MFLSSGENRSLQNEPVYRGLSMFFFFDVLLYLERMTEWQLCVFCETGTFNQDIRAAMK